MTGRIAGPEVKRGELGSIQFLRFVASTLVVLFHTEVQLYRLSGGARPNQVEFAAYGTDLFFVISGFIMVYITSDRKIGFKDFIKRRLIRIVPLYWVATAFLILVWFVWREAFNSTRMDVWHVLATFAFLPYPHPVLGVQQPLMPVGWTLNYYMFFYLAFGACLFLSSPRRIAAVSSLLIALVVAQMLVHSNAGLLKFYGATVQLEFIYGMVIAALYLRWPVAGWAPIVAAGGISVMVFTGGIMHGTSEGAERALFWGVSGAGLLLACILYERRVGWPAGGLSQRLGNASYSIFLSNLFSLGALGMLFRKIGLYSVVGGPAVQTILVVSTLVFGYLAHLLVEPPLMKAFNQERIWSAVIAVAPAVRASLPRSMLSK